MRAVIVLGPKLGQQRTDGVGALPGVVGQPALKCWTKRSAVPLDWGRWRAIITCRNVVAVASCAKALAVKCVPRSVITNAAQAVDRCAGLRSPVPPSPLPGGKEWEGHDERQ